MKRLLFVLFAVLAFIVTFAAIPVFVVDLDPGLQTLIELAAVYVMTALFKWLGGLIKVDLSDLAAIAAAGLAAIIVSILSGLLRAVPPNYETLAAYVMKIIVILLGGMGLYSFKKNVVRAFKKPKG